MDPTLLDLTASQALWLLAWVPLVALIHEAGHALAARPAGYRVTSFGVGMGAPLLRHRGKRGVVFTVNRWLFAGGACVAVPLRLTQDLRSLLFHAGGGLAQAALALVLAVLPGWWWVDHVAHFNLLVLTWNLVPWRVGGMASDGWWILAHLRPGDRGPGLLFARRAPFQRIRDFEARAGSPVGVWYAELMLAWMDLQVGALDRADRFFGEEHDESAVDPQLDAIAQALQADWHRRHNRPLAALRAVRELRSAGLSLSDDADGLLNLVEARSLLDLGEARQARQALGRLAGATRTVAADAALARLEIALCESDVTEVAAAADRVIDPNHPAPLWPAETVQTLWRAGQLLQSEGQEAVGTRLLRASRQRAARTLSQAPLADRQRLVLLLGEAAGTRPAPAPTAAEDATASRG